MKIQCINCYWNKEEKLSTEKSRQSSALEQAAACMMLQGNQ